MKSPHSPILPVLRFPPSAFRFVILAGLALVTPARAVVNIDYVTVGNAGNAPDAATGSLYGAVAYAYQIGTYEVTNAQYAEFLNAKGASNAGEIFNSSMASYGITQTGSSGSYSYSVTGGFENKPVVFVSWFDTARFSNWLGNGQGSSDMETGAYTLGGATSGSVFAKNSGATVYLPSENEWYKAAYYNGGTSSYSLYPNGQNSMTDEDGNYISSGITGVGSYNADSSPYGTFDQGGNVWEYNDLDALSGLFCGMRGGAWSSGLPSLATSSRYDFDPSTEDGAIGFRVASAVPEPTSLFLTLLASGTLLLRRKRG